MSFIKKMVLSCFIAMCIATTAAAAVNDRDFSLVTNTTVGRDFQSPYLIAQADTGVVTADSQHDGVAGSGGYTQAQIAEMINNPLGELWMLWMENDTVWYDGDALDKLGEDPKRFNTFTIEPVMPVQLTEDWKLIFRPVIPIASYEVPDSFSLGPPGHVGGTPSIDVDWERETGLGDIVLWNALAKNEWAKPPNVYGFGPTFMLPTATDDVLGTGKWSAGPLALAFHIGSPGGFIYGTVIQHWWSFAGDDDRKDVNMTNIQYVGYYRLSDKTNIGFQPNIVANWENDSDDVWAIPIGGGINTMTKIGPLPVKLGMEVYYYVEKPDNFGPEWQLRLTFVPVVPKPAWSKRPMVGD